MSDTVSIPDGVHALVPYDQMVEPARKLRDTYARKTCIPLFKRVSLSSNQPRRPY